MSSTEPTSLEPAQFTSIGGQAVLEGVMMRSPHFITVAVRTPDGKIKLLDRPFKGLAARFPFLKKPILRGIVTLLESMIQGIDALSYSANVAAEGEGEGEKLTPWAMALSIGSAILMGIGLFVALPHILTAWIVPALEDGTDAASRPLFHLLDGAIKMGILLLYVYAIAFMQDIRRVFQYHGAEHKSIYAFEAGEELTVENARRHSTLHPRCGTSFLLFLILISIVVFSVVLPMFGLTRLFEKAWLNHVAMVVAKAGLMLPVAGLAYELIKASAFRMNNPLFRLLVLPGLMLQKLTTREPTDDQIEVALASLKRVLKSEKEDLAIADSREPRESVISGLFDLGTVSAQVAEFPEG